MSKSNIEWTEDTWNPIVGCSIVSPGCTNCYAMTMAARIEAMNAGALPGHGTAVQYNGTTRRVNGNAIWTGKLAMAGDNILLQPLKRKKPTTYFVNSMGDLFHESVPYEWIRKVFGVMARCPQHTFQILTKRAARMRETMQHMMDHPSDGVPIAAGMVPDTPISITFLNGGVPVMGPLRNVWLGVSTERQQEADERIPLLLQTPAAIRFVSAEPLLGPINLTSINHRGVVGGHSALHDRGLGQLDWVIVGGESGPDARPMHPDWARSLRVQCEAAGVAFFFKQWGEFKPVRGLLETISESKRSCAIDVDGKRPPGDPMTDDGVSQILAAVESGSYQFMAAVGKARAGRSLDGIEYSQMPEASTCRT